LFKKNSFGKILVALPAKRQSACQYKLCFTDVIATIAFFLWWKKYIQYSQVQAYRN
jgi:hypothetical protein